MYALALELQNLLFLNFCFKCLTKSFMSNVLYFVVVGSEIERRISHRLIATATTALRSVYIQATTG